MRALLVVLAALLLVISAPARAEDASADASADADCPEVSDCPVDLSDLLDDAGPEDADAGAALPDAGPPPATQTTLIFFWGEGCQHCAQAAPFVESLARERPELRVEKVEVRRDPDGRRRFLHAMQELRAGAVGIPTFVIGGEYVVGFVPGTTEEEVRGLVGRALRGEKSGAESRVVELPLLGRLDAASVPLPAFTLAIGLVDGINPCAMWVLLVLLSILAHVKSRARLLLFGATFVVASGIVYFVFMTAWMQVFGLIGLSRYVTIALGAIVVVMGLINLKELIWFEKGVSLMIPDKAKPGLYRRMRGIARSASLPAAFAGIAMLAFLVNLIELGCTLGLPAVYTRILSLRTDLSPAGRHAYVALYNVAYVVPLALIVGAYAATLHRITLSERGAKVLKGVSGTLLIVFGALFLLAPDVLR